PSVALGTARSSRASRGRPGGSDLWSSCCHAVCHPPWGGKRYPHHRQGNATSLALRARWLWLSTRRADGACALRPSRRPLLLRPPDGALQRFGSSLFPVARPRGLHGAARPFSKL